MFAEVTLQEIREQGNLGQTIFGGNRGKDRIVEGATNPLDLVGAS